MPLTLKLVARQADTVELMQRVTWYGPTRRMPFSRSVSAAFDLVGGRAAARAHDEAGARVADLLRVRPAWAMASSSAICA